MAAGLTRGHDTILVTGATGRQGGAVARRLLAAGWAVRALTRSAEGENARALAAHGADVVVGNLDDRRSVERAVEGAYGVFGVQNFWEHGAEREIRQGKTLADAARAAGVSHFVYSSVGGAERGTGVGHIESKWEVENHIRTLGLPATIVRPVFFMENLEAPHYRSAIREGRLALGLRPAVGLQLVATDDVGAFVDLAFSQPDTFTGKAVELAGDELTGDGLADALTRVTGRQVRFVPLPLERVRAMRPEVAEMFDWLNRDGYHADLAACRKLLPDLLSFETWLAQRGWAELDADDAPETHGLGSA